MMTSGVATPSAASNNIAVVIAIPATNPASKPAEMAFILLIAANMSCRGSCAKPAFVSFDVRWCKRRYNNSFALYKNFPRALHDHRGCDPLHAGMIERALAQAPIVARRARQVDAHY